MKVSQSIDLFNDKASSKRYKFRVQNKWEIVLVFLVSFGTVVLTTIVFLKAHEKRSAFLEQVNQRTVSSSSSLPKTLQSSPQTPSKHKSTTTAPQLFNKNIKFNSSQLNQKNDFDSESIRENHAALDNSSLSLNQKIEDPFKFVHRGSSLTKKNRLHSQTILHSILSAADNRSDENHDDDRYTKQLSPINGNYKNRKNSSLLVQSNSAGRYQESQQTRQRARKPSGHKLYAPDSSIWIQSEIKTKQKSATKKDSNWPLQNTLKALSVNSNVNRMKIGNERQSALPRLFQQLNLHQNSDYLTPNDIVWLHMTRPELFYDDEKKFESNPNQEEESFVVPEIQRRTKRQSNLYSSDQDNAELLSNHNDDEETEMSHKDDQSNEDRLKARSSIPDMKKKNNKKRLLKKFHLKKRVNSTRMKKMVKNNDEEENFQQPDTLQKMSSKKKKSRRHRINNNDDEQEKEKNFYNRAEVETASNENIKKFDILGSGNFEIIPGGILSKPETNNFDEKKIPNPPISKTIATQVKKNKQKSSKKNSINSSKQNHLPDDDDDDDENSNANGNENDDNTDHESPSQKPNHRNTFEPFNLNNIFENDPILNGFQGYDDL